MLDLCPSIYIDCLRLVSVTLIPFARNGVTGKPAIPMAYQWAVFGARARALSIVTIETPLTSIEALVYSS